MGPRSVIKRTTAAGVAAAAAAAFGFGAVAGAATPARADWIGSEGSVTGASTPFPVPAVVVVPGPGAPTVAALHVAATPVSGDATELRVTDPVPEAPSVQVHWSNLDTGASGDQRISGAPGDAAAARVDTGPGTVVAFVTAEGPTLLPGAGSFAGE